MFAKKPYEIRKKISIQYFLSQGDIQNFRALLDWKRSFCFSYKKHYQKWKILFSTKSMQGTKKMPWKKILRFKKIYKLTSDYFFIRFISFHLFIKNVFMKIKNSIFPPKYTRYEQKCYKTKLLIFKIFTTLVSNIFSYDLHLLFIDEKYFWKWKKPLSKQNSTRNKNKYLGQI